LIKLSRYRAHRVSLFLLVCRCLPTILVILPAPAAAAPQQPATQRFLIASDLHFNPMADAKLVDELSSAPASQWEAILNRPQSTAFSQYGQDTNWWLLRSALDAMRTNLPHPAFILLTGDMLAHKFPSTFRQTAKDNSAEAYRQFVLKTMDFLALQWRNRFPHTPILLTPGNNDDECGDYNIEAGGPFLHDTAGLARKLARADEPFVSSWESLGSYDVLHPAFRNARIISLNTVFFSNKYQSKDFAKGCAPTSSTAPEDLFAWLEQRLDRAHEAHEKVWLIFHIPPGMDGFSSLFQYQSLLKTKGDQAPAQVCASALVPMWTPSWTVRFDALLARYKDTVVASFAGHTHTDDFRVIGTADLGSWFVLINPAISPIYNQNPAFRVATFGRDGSLIDATVYYLTNLLYASSTTPGEWKREYTFSQEWKMRGVNANSLAKLYGEIQGDEADRADWLKLYNTSSSAEHLPPGSAPALYCAIEGLNAESYGSCFCSAVAQVQK